MTWKYFYSSVKGTSHIKSNTLKQDACKISVININNMEYLIATVADGAGSAKHSDLSSKFICNFFTNCIVKYIKNNSIEDLKKEDIERWFIKFQAIICRATKFYKIGTSRDFATTLLLSVLSKKSNLFIQIGDGIIAIETDKDFECVFLPQNGEFLNTTNFATENNALDKFMYKVTSDKVNKIIMHSDGIEQIAYNFLQQKPFEPFFKPFFNALEKVNKSGNSESLSNLLETFLKSEKVNNKTDDDKTLFLAMLNEDK